MCDVFWCILVSCNALMACNTCKTLSVLLLRIQCMHAVCSTFRITVSVRCWHYDYCWRWWRAKEPGSHFSNFYRTMLCISAAYAVMRCLCVCVSVMFVHCVKTNKDILRFFLPPGSHTILVFPHQTGWHYSNRNPPNGGIKCRWGRLKSRKQ